MHLLSFTPPMMSSQDFATIFWRIGDTAFPVLAAESMNNLLIANVHDGSISIARDEYMEKVPGVVLMLERNPGSYLLLLLLSQLLLLLLLRDIPTICAHHDSQRLTVSDSSSWLLPRCLFSYFSRVRLPFTHLKSQLSTSSSSLLHIFG